ncbi:hypothetical protein D9M68_901990 [compost metagenome]
MFIDRPGNFGIRILKPDVDLVSNLKAAVFTQVLDAVHKITGNAFLFQVFGHVDVEGHGQAALHSQQPAGNVLREDFHIAQGNVKAVKSYRTR